MRPIDADALLKSVYDCVPVGIVGRQERLLCAEGLINNAPTVSPDEVRGLGKWIMSKEFKGYAMCSCCEDAFVDPEWIAKDGKWNYCPNCGARMEVSEDV